jgi:hypothetical protein
VAIIDVVTFRTRDGVPEADLLAADQAVQTTVVPFLAGFIRRTTARAADGSWAVIELWADEATADAARAAADEAATRFASLIDAASIERQRFTTLD